jgi:hypothetical protein
VALASAADDLYTFEHFDFSDGDCWGIFNLKLLVSHNPYVELLAEPCAVFAISIIWWFIWLGCWITSNGKDGTLLNLSIFIAYVIYFTRSFGNTKLSKSAPLVELSKHSSTDFLTMATLLIHNLLSLE